jgi:hypothetical protein
MSVSTRVDVRCWQTAAVTVLQELIQETPDLPPMTWQVGTTAELFAVPCRGVTNAERQAAMEAWAAYLGAELKTQEDGEDVIWRVEAERTAPSGKTVRVIAYDRTFTGE